MFLGVLMVTLLRLHVDGGLLPRFGDDSRDVEALSVDVIRAELAVLSEGSADMED